MQTVKDSSTRKKTWRVCVWGGGCGGDDGLLNKKSVIQWPCVRKRKRQKHRLQTSAVVHRQMCASAAHIDSISIFTQPEMDPLKRCSYNTPAPAMNCRSIFQGCIYLQGQTSCWSPLCSYECLCASEFVDCQCLYM